jgi:3-hydroxy-9,10-secoandrosta-1,3,5(10)-triene-9,17-dione monooxygenase reductase component
VRSRTLAAVRHSRGFVVNVLASDQEQVSRIFAGKQPEPDKFACCAYAERAGVPVIEGTIAWLRCRLDAVHPGGDHVIVVGNVVEMGGNGGEPLLYYGGHYRRLDRADVACGAGRR